MSHGKAAISKWIVLSLMFLAAVTGRSHVVMGNEFCPFCSAVNATFSDQIQSNHIVVVAKLTKQAKPIDDLDLDLPRAELEITQIHKGADFVAEGMRFNALLVGTYELGQEFLVMGVDPPAVVWSTPLKVNDRIIDYIKKIQELPAEGADRLFFFQAYFEDADTVLAYDAYDEFAQSRYEDLIALKDRMDREKLLKWISDVDVPVNRRRLYLTMLGVCGKSEDAAGLEDIIRSGDRERQAGLDALVASYLMLKGEDGLDLIDKELIDNPQTEDIQLLSVRSSLAFHSTEAKIISRERILVSLRKYLDRPALADAVIPDLSRLKDWSVIEKLVGLFKTADNQHKWVRVPIIQYLQECPEPAAKTHLAELALLDPDSVKRASFLSNFDFGDEDFDDEKSDDDDSDDGESGDGDGSDESVGTQGDQGKTENGQGNGTGGNAPALGIDGSDGSQEFGSVAANPEINSPVVGLETADSPVVVVKKVAIDLATSQSVAEDISVEDNVVEETTAVAMEGPAKSTEMPVEPEVATFTSGASPVENNRVLKESAGPMAGPLDTGSNEMATEVGMSSNNRVLPPVADRPGPTPVPSPRIAVNVPGSNANGVEGLTAEPSLQPESPKIGFAIITVPMIASFAIFLLIWSVISGWFERLIF